MVSQDNTHIDETDKKILQILQDDFPMVEQPWKEIGNKLNLTEKQVIDRLQNLRKKAIIGKIGAVLNASKLGFSAATLVAFKVPQDRVPEVSAIINQYSEVSHNYEREYEYNVWFTLKAPSYQELATKIEEIAQKAAITSQNILSLPTKDCFKINVHLKIL